MRTYKSAYEGALQMIGEGCSSREVLSYLTKEAESLAVGDTVSSILLLDEGGALRNGASPRLPDDYLQAIDGLRPDPNVGTCAAAAATGSMVVTEDFYADNKWAELRHLPLALGFKGAWSIPITNAEGKVIGTFGTYFRTRRIPTQQEIEGIRLLTGAAARALEPTHV